MTCTECGKEVHPLAVFPGRICLECHAANPEGQRMPTADEVVAMWGGKVVT